MPRSESPGQPKASPLRKATGWEGLLLPVEFYHAAKLGGQI